MALAPGEDLDRDSRAAEPDRGLGRRPAQSRPAQRHVADSGRREHRRDQMGAAAVVLLVGVGGVLAVLVGGDRLVLDAVVGREVTAAQRQQRGRHAHERHGGLAAGRARARPARSGGADRLPAEGRGTHRAERPQVLHRQPRLRQRALHQGDHGHRLGELHDAADARAVARRPCRRGRACGRRRPSTRRRPCAPPPPSAWARGPEGRCGAPCRPGAACPQEPGAVIFQG